MNSSFKKIIIIVVGIAIIVGIVGVYLFLRRTSVSQGPESGSAPSFWGFGGFSSSTSNLPSPIEPEFSSSSEQQALAQEPPVLIHVATNIAPGSNTFIKISTSSPETLRYVERQTGNIFEYDLTTLSARRVSATTLPGIQRVLWGFEGKDVILQFIDEKTDSLKTLFAHVDEDTSESLDNTHGEFLADNLETLALNSISSDLVYTQQKNDTTLGLLRTGSTTSMFFETPISDWSVFWPTPTKLFFSTKASGEAPGVVYEVNPLNKTSRRLPLYNYGLSILPDETGSSFIFSSTAVESFPTLFVFDTEKELARNLSLKTFAEKCAWIDSQSVFCGVPRTSLEKTTLPDAWYQGIVSFSDTFWIVNIQTGRAFDALDPEKETSIPMDVTSVKISNSKNYASFINKKDGDLWIIRL